jgi:hypothetical protein
MKLIHTRSMQISPILNIGCSEQHNISVSMLLPSQRVDTPIPFITTKARPSPGSLGLRPQCPPRRGQGRPPPGLGQSYQLLDAMVLKANQGLNPHPPPARHRRVPVA